jgi:hypothetical protein
LDEDFTGPLKSWIKVKNPKLPAATRLQTELSEQSSFISSH